MSTQCHEVRTDAGCVEDGGRASRNRHCDRWTARPPATASSEGCRLLRIRGRVPPSVSADPR